MSWLFSQALVAEYLPVSCLEIEPSALLNATGTPQAFSSDDKTTECYRRSRYGMTCGPLTENRGAELLIAYLVVSHVRTSALPAEVRDLPASAQAFGASLPAWFAKWSHQLSEWRTAHFSLLEDSESFSETWPRSGLMLDGMCYPQPSMARTTCENVSGSLLPTLAARDYRHPNVKSFAERGGGKKGEQLPNVLGGPLNPDWCEWFMGFPIGWTASSALATAKFREWQQQHGVCSDGQ
jgi:hypothetical protein